MASTQPQINTNNSNDDMLDEIPESSVNNYHLQQHTDQISDSDESFKSIENFEPIKLDFIRKFAKISGKLSSIELEEILLQKVTESMVYKTKYAEIRIKLDLYEELIQRQKLRIELLEKQYADLEVTHDRILTAIRENPQAPIEPLKIVRAVSCQVYQPTAEYINSMPDPIVIRDSPKKRRARRKNGENGKGRRGRKNTKKVSEITIDTSDEDDENVDENNRKVTRSNAKNLDNKKDDQQNSTNAPEKIVENSEVDKTQTKSTEIQVENTSKLLTSSKSKEDKDLLKSANNNKNPIQHGKNSSENLTKADQNSSKIDQNSSNAERNSSKRELNSSKTDQNSSKFKQHPKSSDPEPSKTDKQRGIKRKPTKVLDIFGKKNESSSNNTTNKSNSKNSENTAKLTSNNATDSDSDNDVTIIEDDEEVPVPKRQKTLNSSTKSSNSSTNDIELPKVLEKLARASKLIEKSTKAKNNNSTSDFKKSKENFNNITSKSDNVTSKVTENSKTDHLTSNSNISSPTSPTSTTSSPKSVSSSSPEPETSIPAQKSFKVPTIKPKLSKASRPGPKCSKISNKVKVSSHLLPGGSSSQGSSSILKVSDKLLSSFENGHKNPQNISKISQNGSRYPPSASKVLPSPFDSTKKSSTFDQSYDSFNFSSLDTLSSFKSSANLVTSTPLKAVDQGLVKAVKRTLDMNFNKNSINKIPKLPPKGPQLIHPSLKPTVPSPTIKVEKVNNGIRISWKIENFKPSEHADIMSYQIYAFEEVAGNVQVSTDDWKLVGDVKSLLLPMAVTLREFNEDQKFHFAIRAMDAHKRLGDFSEPKSWE